MTADAENGALDCVRGEDAGAHGGALASCLDYKDGTAKEYRVYKDPTWVCKLLLEDAVSRAPMHASAKAGNEEHELLS